MYKHILTTLTILIGLVMMLSTAAVMAADTSQQAAIKELLNEVKTNQSTAHRTVKQPATAPVVARSHGTQSLAGLGTTADNRAAFVKTLHTIAPLTASQISTLRSVFYDQKRAAATFPGTPPRPTSTSVLVNLSPGATPPVIRLRRGFVTSLVFLDSTGQPWPIVGDDLGDNQSFNLQPTQLDGKNNTLLIQANTDFKQGNLAVMLKGQNTPVMITLMSGQSAVDYRVDLRVPGLGPNAKADFQGLPNAGSSQLMTFLDGVPAQGAKTLTVEGGDCAAWLYAGHIFLRTRLTLLSPGWIDKMSSPDGTHAYEIVNTPVVLASWHGQVVQLTIKKEGE